MNAARYRQRLTTREREILGAICAGERPREIAERLFLREQTVRNYLCTAKVKLGARTTPHLAVEYVTRYKGPP